MLETCPRAVILDVPSFPWPIMQGRRLDTPMVLRLPEQLDAVVLSQLLGAGVLARLTPYDRLLHGDPGVREQLSERWELPDVWLSAAELLAAPAADPRAWRAALGRRLGGSGAGGPTSARPATTRCSRPRRRNYSNGSLPSLRTKRRTTEGRTGWSLWPRPRACRACALPEFGDRMLRLERFEPDAEGPDPRLAPPGAAVVLLADEGQPADERGRLIARAARVLPAGGTLMASSGTSSQRIPTARTRRWAISSTTCSERPGARWVSNGWPLCTEAEPSSTRCGAPPHKADQGKGILCVCMCCSRPTSPSAAW